MSKHTHTIARTATNTGSVTLPDCPSLTPYAKVSDLSALAARVAVLESASVNAMPTTDLPGWRLIWADDFDAWQPTHYFCYPTNYPDTSGNGYNDPSIISASGSILTLAMGGSQHKVDTFIPLLPGSLSAPAPERGDLLGMRYSFRIRADKMPGFKGVPLLWPVSGSKQLDGEIDFPESDFNNVDIAGAARSPMAFIHLTNEVGDEETSFATPAGTTWQDWHTYVVEWVPGVSVTLYMDGTLIGRSTNRIPNSPMHLCMQFETTLYGFVPDPLVAGKVQIAWLAVWAVTA